MSKFVNEHVHSEKPSVPNVKYEVEVNLIENYKPFNYMPRRLSHKELVDLQEIIVDLLSKGVIRESDSCFASSIILVKKKTGETRLCVDCRHLNKICVRDRYPLSLIEDQLDKLKGKIFFTKLDLRSAFHQVKIMESSRQYTSFVTPLV